MSFNLSSCSDIGVKAGGLSFRECEYVSFFVQFPICVSRSMYVVFPFGDFRILLAWNAFISGGYQLVLMCATRKIIWI